jgi:hypothetical protein
MERGQRLARGRGVDRTGASVQLELRLRARGDALLVEDTVFLGPDVVDETLQTCLRDLFDGQSLSAPNVRLDTAYRLPFTIWN